MTIGNVIKIDDLNEKAEKVDEAEDPTGITQEYDGILLTKRKGIIPVPYCQGKVFKRFKKKKTFIKMVSKLKIQTSTIIFKIKIFKLIDKHPKLMKSSATLGFLKNYYKDIKQI